MAAHTLEQRLEAVPLLGECDTLEAVSVLARCDRESYGWFTISVFWLASVAMVVWLMLGLCLVLFLVAGSLASWLTPPVEDVLGTIGGTLLWLLILAVGALLALLIFNRAGPRRWLGSATNRLRRRIRLRVLLLQAIRSQRARNQRLINGRWQKAVCRTCLARYKAYRVRFAYLRWITFGHCRKCLDDSLAYTGVERIAGWLDHGMAHSHDQVGNVVRVNMLYRLPPRSESLPIDLDELVVANVEDEDVELLIFFYRSEQPQTELPKPKRLRCRLMGLSNVSQTSRRQLKRHFALVT